MMFLLPYILQLFVTKAQDGSDSGPTIANCREVTFEIANECSSLMSSSNVFYANEKEVNIRECFRNSDTCTVEVCGNFYSDPDFNVMSVFTFDSEPFIYTASIEGRRLTPGNFSFPPSEYEGFQSVNVNNYDYFCAMSFNSAACQCADDKDLVVHGGPNYLWYDVVFDVDEGGDDNNNDDNNNDIAILASAGVAGMAVIAGLLIRRRKKIESVHQSVRLMDSKNKDSSRSSEDYLEANVVPSPSGSESKVVAAPVVVPAPIPPPTIVPLKKEPETMENLTSAEIINRSKREHKASKRGKSSPSSARSGGSKRSKSKRNKHSKRGRVNSLTTKDTQGTVTTILTTDSKEKLIKQYKKFRTTNESNKSKETNFSAVLSRLSYITFNTKPGDAKGPKPISIGSKERSTIRTMISHEQRVKFLSERISWRSYTDSVELYAKSREAIELICNNLDSVTLSEADIKSSHYENDNDYYAGESIPEITLADYLYILVSGADEYHEESNYMKNSGKGAGIRSLIVALIYIGRIKEKEKNFVLTVYNVHRVFAVTVLLALKTLEDDGMTNTYWAYVSGLDVSDLNEVETEFCKSVQFDFFVEEIEMQVIYQQFGLNKLLA